MQCEWDHEKKLAKYMHVINRTIKSVEAMRFGTGRRLA
jgi:hypothetical protein